LQQDLNDCISGYKNLQMSCLQNFDKHKQLLYLLHISMNCTVRICLGIFVMHLKYLEYQLQTEILLSHMLANFTSSGCAGCISLEAKIDFESISEHVFKKRVMVEDGNWEAQTISQSAHYSSMPCSDVQ
jgi:hypothetical protein